MTPTSGGAPVAVSECRADTMCRAFGGKLACLNCLRSFMLVSLRRLYTAVHFQAVNAFDST